MYRVMGTLVYEHLHFERGNVNISLLYYMLSHYISHEISELYRHGMIQKKERRPTASLESGVPSFVLL